MQGRAQGDWHAQIRITAAVAAAALTGLAGAAQAAPPAPDAWQFEFTPYIFGSSLRYTKLDTDLDLAVTTGPLLPGGSRRLSAEQG